MSLLKITRRAPLATGIKTEILHGILWFSVVAAGLGVLLSYSSTPGSAFQSPLNWPALTIVERPDGLPKLLMFVHPKCPCSRASLEELDAILASGHDRVLVEVVFVEPPGFKEKWVESDLWKKASQMTGVKVRVDHGEEAKRFNVATSGQTLLYDKNGHLVFAGGITQSRGHAGNNAGRAAITSFLLTGRAEKSSTPVFGCGLFAAKTMGQA